ncbi:nuclear transport factor 2 family protein [Sphingomonas sp.]|uniref:nuclear transport factor 2 family protein n=1 Tax=Sphingomonas sp. TaxID=28214 RepID=UPI0025FCE076|nr:nuclear transport factor 2 family protein [Sphingomonas sp.]
MPLLLALTLQAASAPAVAIPTGRDLRTAVAAADAALFKTFFEECEPAKLDAMLTPDFEMYHDRDGVVARDGKAMVALYTKQCEAKKAPDAWRSRRELVADSLNVEPVPGFGAIEEGNHVFYERKGDGPEKLVGRAHFVQLWQMTSSGWRLSRVLSYSHRAAGATPEAAKP